MSKKKSKTKKAPAKGAKKTDVNKIDQLIAEAQQKKAARAAGEKVPKTPDPEKEAAKAAKDAEKAAKQAEREADKAKKLAEREAVKVVKKAEREAKKLAKQAEREAKRAAKKPAHIAKLERAEAKLPRLSPGASNVFDDAVQDELTATDYATLAEHFAFKARSMQTLRALDTKLEEGDSVKILTGKHAGSVGTIEKAQRIRCYVNVAGADKAVYLFTSDVEKVEAEAVEAADETAAEAIAA